jgi:hypothetical protein
MIGAHLIASRPEPHSAARLSTDSALTASSLWAQLGACQARTVLTKRPSVLPQGLRFVMDCALVGIVPIRSTNGCGQHFFHVVLCRYQTTSGGFDTGGCCLKFSTHATPQAYAAAGESDRYHKTARCDCSPKRSCGTGVVPGNRKVPQVGPVFAGNYTSPTVRELSGLTGRRYAVAFTPTGSARSVMALPETMNWPVVSMWLTSRACFTAAAPKPE